MSKLYNVLSDLLFKIYCLQNLKSLIHFTDEYVLSAFDTEHQINEIPESFDLSRLMNGDVDGEFSGNRDISCARDNRSLDVLELEPVNGNLRFFNSYF